MVDSPALAELTQRVRGAGAGAGASLSVEASLGRIARRMEQQAADERECQRAIQPVILPAVRLLTSAAGTLLSDPALSLLGPEDGQAWDVRRLTVNGLVAAIAGEAVGGQGQVTSPGSNVAIATIAAANITPGTYLINWTVSLGGTPSATDIDNFRLKIGTTNLFTSSNPGAVGEFPQAQFGPVLLTGAQNVTVNSVAAGTVGAIYAADISLIPVAGDQVTLYREIGGAGGGNPENALWTFTPPGSSPGPTWNPGGGLILRSPEGLLLAGTGLAAASVTLSGEAIAVETPWLWKYLL